MTRDQIVTLVLSRLGRSENNSYLVGRAREELALIQERLEGGAFMPWFLLSGEVTSLVTVADTRTVDLPSNFLREYEDFPLYRYDSTASDPYIRLAKGEFDHLESYYEGQSAGVPVAYALVGTQLHFFVTPDAAYPLRWNYYKKQDVLSDSVTTNGWTNSASDLLVAELGFIMAAIKRDTFMKDTFGGEIIRAMTRLLAFDEARKQALRDAQRGDLD